MKIPIWVGTVFATAAGLFVAWVDASPGWDDTAISVGVILLVTGILGELWPRWAWWWALAVGVWIPLWALTVTHNSGAVLALFVAAVGAFAGAGANRLFRAVIASDGSGAP